MDFLRQRDKEYYEVNRDAIRERQKQYNAANKEQHAAYRRANRDHRNELKRQSRMRHAEDESGERERERNRQLALKWRKENPERHKENIRKYRALRAGAEGSFTQAEWVALCESCDNRCLRCGTTENITADHVVPLSKGGADSIENIQPLCKSCNCSKGTKIIDYR